MLLQQALGRPFARLRPLWVGVDSVGYSLTNPLKRLKYYADFEVLEYK